MSRCWGERWATDRRRQGAQCSCTLQLMCVPAMQSALQPVLNLACHWQRRLMKWLVLHASGSKQQMSLDKRQLIQVRTEAYHVHVQFKTQRTAACVAIIYMQQ